MAQDESNGYYEEWLRDRQRQRRKLQEECPHSEHKNGYCLACGKDVLDELIGHAELMREDWP